MKSAQEAREIILRSVAPLGTISVALRRALHRVLAEKIVAHENIPSFDNSAMDGFAVRAEDVGQIPVTLSVVGEISAGSLFNGQLKKHETVSIMTGGKLPAGCDAVVQQEWTEKIDEQRVKIVRAVQPGHNIRRAGADIASGTTVFENGQYLRPQEIGVLASLGKRFVEVYRPPGVALLTTGNEIIDIDKPLVDGKIRNSNAFTLAALLDETGCEAADIGIAKDDREELKQKISNGLKADALITSGGVSVGKYDLVMDVLKELGAEIQFWKVNIKPGMPFMYAMCEGRPVFGLPGNPVSTMVTFLQFVKPALMKMSGRTGIDSGLRIRAKLGHEIKKTDGKRYFTRGILEQRDGALVVRSTGSQISNILTSLAKANCLIIIPEEKETVSQNEEVEVELL